MTRITAFIKAHRLEPVKAAIAATGATGLTVGDIRGVGTTNEDSSLFTADGVMSLPIRARIDVVVTDSMVEEVIASIRHVAYTGEPDDGKIFLEKVLDVVRVRTEERGDDAL